MRSAIIPTSIAIPRSAHADLCSSRVSISPSQFSTFSFPTGTTTPPRFTIRMGGGPRTYPGGVSKWQWKRMQAKKSKQLLKARLCRERQIYEMRKRAELKAAVSELERPWEVVDRAPTLFSVKADEQVKVLADRFQKPGGFDMWSERDGPQVFRAPDGRLPSARFFPKGVVHSVRPYGVVSGLVEGEEDGGSGASSDASDQHPDKAVMRRRNGGKDGSSASSGDVGRMRRNLNYSYGGNGNFSELGESDSSESEEEEEVLELVDRIEMVRGRSRTSSSQYSDRQKDGRLRQKGDARFEGLSSASPRIGRKGTSRLKTRNSRPPNAVHGRNDNFAERGRMVDGSKHKQDEDRFSFNSSKSSSSSPPNNSHGKRMLKSKYNEIFDQ